MIEINLPFPGLYGTSLESILDSEEQRFCENEFEEQAGEWPKELCISERDLSDILYTCGVMNHGAAREKIAREWLESFDSFCGELFDENRTIWAHSWAEKKKIRHKIPSCGLKFSLMTSPREYNFETDRLFADVPESFIRKLWRMSRDDSHETLCRVICERFTSLSGFISHYSNDLESWGHWRDWDYNQLGTLLIACMRLADAGDYWESHVEESLYDSSYEFFDAGMNYESWCESVTEKRAELLAEWVEDDPESAGKWRATNMDKCAEIVAADPSLFSDIEWRESDHVGAWYRCDVTRDMFGESV